MKKKDTHCKANCTKKSLSVPVLSASASSITLNDRAWMFVQESKLDKISSFVNSFVHSFIPSFN
jgi:hypothetical protein